MGQLNDLYTTENMHKILSNWYGPGAKSWEINDKLVLYVAQMIQESQKCSTLIGFVPRPTGPVGAAKSVSSIVIQEVKALIKKVSNDDHAIACLKGVAYQKKIEVYMLKDGI